MQNVESDSDEVIDVENLDSQFGNSEVKNFKKFEKVDYHQLKNGDNVYRVMPPMFSAMETGHFAIYYPRHYGYTNERGQQVNFICLRQYDNSTKAITQECPFCVDQEKKKKTYESFAAQVNVLQNQLAEAQQKNNRDEAHQLEEELETAESEFNRAKALYNSRNTRFWVNAMNLAGEFGLLALPKTVYEALVGKKLQDPKTGRYTRQVGLIAKIKEEEQLDPLAVNEGVWFVMSRSGKTQFDTEYLTSIKKEKVEFSPGKWGEVIKRAPLTDDQKRTALSKCRDLNHVFDHLIVSVEQAQAIVDGSATAVTAIQNSPQTVEKASKPEVVAAPVAQTAAPKFNNAALLEKFKKL